MADQTSNGSNNGSIVEIKGVVLDAVFPDKLPDIYSALSIQTDRARRADRRGAAASRRRPRPRGRDGLDRRPRARHRGRRHRAADLGSGRRPDARAHLERHRRSGRRQGEAATGERWPIHRDPPAFGELSAKIEIFETGIKVIDLIAPYVARRQDRALRRRRRRQDGADQGADPQRRAAARRRVGLHRRRRAHARGQRPHPRDDRVGRDRQGRDRLRPDERAAGRAPARRPVRA